MSRRFKAGDPIRATGKVSKRYRDGTVYINRTADADYQVGFVSERDGKEKLTYIRTKYVDSRFDLDHRPRPRK